MGEKKKKEAKLELKKKVTEEKAIEPEKTEDYPADDEKEKEKTPVQIP